MYASRMERLAFYVLSVQISFTISALGFANTPLSASSSLAVLSAVKDSIDPGPPPFFNASSLPEDDGSKGVSEENLNSAMRRRGKTLYEVLDASPTATRAELKKKYVEMAKLSHPDAQIGMDGLIDAPDFGEVAAAWRVLGNSKSRKRYDRELQYKEWAEFASNFANEKMEEAVPAVARIMDNLALPFLRRTAATTVAVSQVVSNIAKTVDSSSKGKTQNENKNSITDAFMNAVRAGQKAGRAIDTLELNEKSVQLSQRAQNDEKRAREIQQELNSVTQQRLLATLASDKATLSSDEARQVLDQITIDGREPDRPQNIQRIERDIVSLQETEQIFMEKLKAYEQTDREWKNLLSKQEYARNDLTNRKREEAEARKRLDEAIRMVSEAKANLVAISIPLRSVEQVVRKNASEIDQVTFTLSKKQERVRKALRQKASMSSGGIQLHYLSEEDLAALRRREMQLTGESEQLATMVARLSARAEKLKSRAAALDSYQDPSFDGGPPMPSSPSARPVGP